MKRFLVVALLMASAATGFAQPLENEAKVWKLERDYWEYVKALDLEKYKTLWHSEFLGWPYVSAEPVAKDGITGWIDELRAKGLHLQSFTLRPAGSRTTGDIVVTYYWLTALWVDKDGHGEPRTSRITHTWIKTGKEWQIFAGMSAEINQSNK